MEHGFTHQISHCQETLAKGQNRVLKVLSSLPLYAKVLLINRTVTETINKYKFGINSAIWLLKMQIGWFSGWAFPSLCKQEALMVFLLCAVAMETVCGMWSYIARKCCVPVEKELWTVKKWKECTTHVYWVHNNEATNVCKADHSSKHREQFFFIIMTIRRHLPLKAFNAHFNLGLIVFQVLLFLTNVELFLK